MSPKGRKVEKIMNDIEKLKVIIPRAETFDDIEKLDLIADALAAQALGGSQILAEQFNLKTEKDEDY